MKEPLQKNEVNILFRETFPSGNEVIRISKDGFYYNGERIDDIHNVYEKFNEFLNNNK